MVPFVIPMVLLVVTLPEPVIPRCLVDHPVVTPQRYFTYEGRRHHITLEVSNRGAHRLTSEIFKIFLEEVLGYPGVLLVEQEDHFKVEKTFKRLSGLTDDRILVPNVTLNLEVWMPPYEDENTWAVSNVEEIGVIGPPGRFGWFVPKPLTGHLNGSLHWSLFKNPHLASTFNIPQVHFLEYVTPHLKNPETNSFYCEKDFCFAGVFVPVQCKKVPCAVLFAEDPEYTSFVVDQIEELGLLVKVAWVGPRLKELVETLTDLYVGGSVDPGRAGQPAGSSATPPTAVPSAVPNSGAQSIVVLTWRPGDIVQDMLDDPVGHESEPNGVSRMQMVDRSPPGERLKQAEGAVGRGVEMTSAELYAEEEGNGIDVGGEGVVGINKSASPSPLHKKSSPKRRREYETVSFPPCETFRTLLSSNCSYEMHRLVKLAWKNLKKGARTAYEAVHLVKFTNAQYRDLLERFTNYRLSSTGGSKDIYSVACDWLLEKNSVWTNWVPKTDQKTVLSIGGIFPYSGTTYIARSVVTAAKMAKKAINSNSTVLRDYYLDLHILDGQCKPDVVMKSFIDYMLMEDYNHFVGILGPACSDTVEPLAGVSRHYKTVVISYSAEGSSFTDRKKYPYFFRTIGENKQYRYVYLKLFNKLGWSRVAALTEDGQKYTEYISHLQDLLQNNSIHFVANRKFPRERSNAAMSQYLLDLKNKNARIIIADVNDKAARSVMCEAYHHNMTARHGYVWFLPLWLSPTWYDTDLYNRGAGHGRGADDDALSSLNDSNKGESGPEQIQCTKEQMLRAIDGHLSMSHSYFANESDVMQENITVKEWRALYRESCTRENISESNYAGYAYDAVWTYALALDALIRENQSHAADLHSDDTARRYVDHINKIDFNGVSGKISFATGPSRISVINIMQWINGSSRIVGSFYPNVKEGSDVVDGNLELNMSAIVWLTANGQKPDDGRKPPKVCVLEGLANLLDVSCEVAIVVANVIGFGFLAILIGAAFILMKRRYEKKVQMQQKYMKSLGLDLLSASSMHSLDKWEIPRDRVVINRKLGEGAFGTVYGGEADFDDRGWMAVAVKTLKIGSNTEEKLDFLSEAEVMKRFDHKNIVRLLGVCTKSEPVYTVMEFMLYGDLKTFLLARRHLVNERNAEESDEISNKKLTNMAMDVARGLSYLAELKYVHRDIASRNCLINTSRVVKIGDFGMTRPMYENDYYKFNRKGMLPVRWMAPESLGLGIFTPMSDVWSYGVFLYELITFGSFPFQGLSNNQVLEHVKAGNTLTIPNGVKPQLDALLISCWNLEVKKRPQASEIVDFLANNPRLISPCLDVPLASVQMEDSDQLEMHLPQRLRKCSMSMTVPGGGTPNPGETMRHRSLSDNCEVSQPFLQGTQGTQIDDVNDGRVSLNMEPQHPTLAQFSDNGSAHEPLLSENLRPLSSSSACPGVSLSKYVILQRTAGGGGGTVGASGGKLVDPRNESMSNTSIL